MHSNPHLLAAAILLCGCSGGSHTLTGEPGTMPGDSVYLLTAGRAHRTLAAAASSGDGSFRLTVRTEGPTICLLTNGSDDPIPVFLDEDHLRLIPVEEGGRAVAGSLSNEGLHAVGRALDSVRTEYYAIGPDIPQEEFDALQAKYRRIVSEAVGANSDNLLGVYLFTQTELPELTPAEARARLALFSAPMQQTELLREVAEWLRTEEKTAPGSPFPELALPGPDGDTVALSGLTGSGQWVLVHFWATWSASCQHETAELKEVFENYRDKGFTIYGVSVDNDRQAWRDFVGRNRLEWPNVHAADRGTCPAAELYGIRSVPSNVLIRPDGRIAAKDLHGNALKAKLTELIR